MTHARSTRIQLKLTLAIAALAFVVAAAACGGDSTAGPPASASSTAASGATAEPAQQTATAGGPAAQQTADAAALADLKPLTLLSGDVPPVLAERSSVPLSRVNVIEALSPIETLQDFISTSSLDGGWATIFASTDPPAALTSIVLRFTNPADAQALIDTIAGLTTADYPGAITLERAPSDKIEDKAQLMRSELPGANTLEYSWAQGRLAGQVVFRYTGAGGGPDDVAQLVQLARKQADLMRIYRQ